MTREILFKAKRLDNGEWVEGNIVAVPRDEDARGDRSPAVNVPAAKPLNTTKARKIGILDRIDSTNAQAKAP